MSEITVNADVRSQLGKRSRALRRTGMIPGVYYGHGQSNVPVSMDETILTPLFRTTATHVINLKLSDGSTHMCILRDVQLDPVTERPVHFDLFGLNENEELTIEVPVQLTGGVPKGVKDGGILQHILHRLEVTCLPKYIPDHVDIDVATLELNHSIHVKDVAIPNVKITSSQTSTIVAVVPPTIVKEPEPTAVAAVPGEVPAEPEVIARGKKVEEGEEEGAEKPEKAEKAEKPEKKPEKKSDKK